MNSVVFGIDVGTSNSIVSRSVKNPFEISHLNFYRKLPTNISYFNVTDSSSYKEKGTLDLNGKDFPSKEIKFNDIKNLLGKDYHDSEIRKTKAFQNYPTKRCSQTNGILILVRTGIVDSKWKHVENIVSDVLFHILEYARTWTNAQDSNEAVISVPGTWNYSQRRAFNRAAHRAGFKVLQLVNSSMASIIDYGYYEAPKIFNLENSSKTDLLVFDEESYITAVRIAYGEFEHLGTFNYNCNSIYLRDRNQLVENRGIIFRDILRKVKSLANVKRRVGDPLFTESSFNVDLVLIENDLLNDPESKKTIQRCVGENIPIEEDYSNLRMSRGAAILAANQIDKRNQSLLNNYGIEVKPIIPFETTEFLEKESLENSRTIVIKTNRSSDRENSNVHSRLDRSEIRVYRGDLISVPDGAELGCYKIDFDENMIKNSPSNDDEEEEEIQDEKENDDDSYSDLRNFIDDEEEEEEQDVYHNNDNDDGEDQEDGRDEYEYEEPSQTTNQKKKKFVITDSDEDEEEYEETGDREEEEQKIAAEDKNDEEDEGDNISNSNVQQENIYHSQSNDASNNRRYGSLFHI
eukprot:gb/GECH01007277.1/.p1 GENE.gb/GECH01007277.1/~~gb/GECH01007277.1/.p1  ORF type:complete len:576 (+),score=158.25 gb/GECH01007277.1/:1-1728(+)